MIYLIQSHLIQSKPIWSHVIMNLILDETYLSLDDYDR